MSSENKLNKHDSCEFFESSGELFSAKDKFLFIQNFLSDFNEKNLNILENMTFTQKDLQYKDQSLMTLLHYASLTGHYSYMQLLIDKGFDINKRDITQPVLFYLIDYNYEQCFYSLLKYNHQLIDIGNTDCFGEDLFLYASKKERGYLFIKHILDFFPHYNKDTTDQQLSNALLLASKIKRLSNKSYLIKLGISPFSNNNKNECAWDFFDNDDKENYFQTLSLLERQKISLLISDKEKGKTGGKKRL